MRLATKDDRQLVLDWSHAFEQESIPADAPSSSSQNAIPLVELARRRSTFASMRPRGHGIRIGPVNTPPKLRRRAEGAEGARPVADAIELRLIEDTDDPITLGGDGAEAVYYALNVPNGSSDQLRALYEAVKRRHDERLWRKS